MLLLAGGRPALYYSDSFRLFDLAAVCPGSVVLASRSCPCLVVHALGEPLPLARLVRDVAKEALVVAAVAAAHPIDHSDLLHARPSAVPALVAVQMKMRIGWERAVAPLGRAAAIAGMACPSLCSTRGGLVKYASRLLCLRPSRHQGALTEDCCTVT